VILYASVILEPYCFCDAHDLVLVYFHFIVVIYLVICIMLFFITLCTPKCNDIRETFLICANDISGHFLFYLNECTY
jgi:hypothetical protein